MDWQTPLSIEIFRQEYWSGLTFPPPGDLADPGTEPVSPVFAGGFFTTEPPGRPIGPTSRQIRADVEILSLKSRGQVNRLEILTGFLSFRLEEEFFLLWKASACS